MTLLDPRSRIGDLSDPMEPQALLAEARRRTRRRRLGFAIVTVLVLGLAATIVALVMTPPSRPKGFLAPPNSGALPTGAMVNLQLAGSLAVGPTGALYVAAPLQHRILVLLPDGKFRAVAGSGKSGYAGDGGPAIDADLSNPYDLTFGPNGSLYFADAGRIREIHSNGTIQTIAGNGVDSAALPAHPLPLIVNGAPAPSTSLGWQPNFAVGRNGQLVVATTRQLLRLEDGRFEQIATHRMSFRKVHYMPNSLDMNLGAIAIDARGNLDVTGFNGWGVWRVEPNGDAYYLGYARQSGGDHGLLTEGPGGAIYVDSFSAIMRLGRSGLVMADNLSKINLRSEYF